MYFDNLSLQILRATWAIEPRLALNYHEFIAKFFSRELDPQGITRQPISISALTPHAEQISLSANAEGEKPYNPFNEAPEKSTAIIPLKGVMLKEDSLCDYGTETLANYIKLAARSEKIQSIIVDIDCGGGAVDSIAPLLEARKFALQQGKMMFGLADSDASAAYYFSSQLDRLWANNNISAAFGSIGVMVSFADMQPYYEKQGVKFHTIYAPESESKNEAFNLALEGKYEMIKSEMLSPLARKFQAAVRQGRNGKIDLTVKGILSGKMFYADDAAKHGMIDGVLSLNQALEEINKIVKN